MLRVCSSPSGVQCRRRSTSVRTTGRAVLTARCRCGAGARHATATNTCRWAEQAGAAAAIVEDAGATRLPVFVVRDARVAASIASGRMVRAPRGCTARHGCCHGTNGKSTTVGILRHLLDEATAHSASIGTIGVFIGSAGEPLPGGSGLTTLDPIELQRVLRALVDRGVNVAGHGSVVHSLDQQRIAGLALDAAVFTNLTRDTLDTIGRWRVLRGQGRNSSRTCAPRECVSPTADDGAWRQLPKRAHYLVLGRGSGGPMCAGIGDSLRTARQPMESRDRPGRPALSVRLPLIGDSTSPNALAAAAAAWGARCIALYDCRAALGRPTGTRPAGGAAR